MACLAAGACAADADPEPAAGDDAADTALDQLIAEFTDELEFPLEASPSGGGELTLCQKPPRREFHAVNAAWMAYLSQDVYAPLSELEPLLRDLGFGSAPGDGMIEMFSGDRGTEVVWAHHPAKDVAVVIFRGTEPLSLRDVFLTDAFAFPDDLDDEPRWGPGWGKVHAGFLRAFEVTVADQLFERLHRLRGTRTRIYLAGHSLGGALAVLFGAQILAEMEAGADYELAGVTTFGAPGVGDREFQSRVHELADRHQVPIVRIRQGRDVITAIPPGFKHVGDLVHLERGDVSVLPDAEPPYLPAPSALDHRCRNYYIKIVEAIRNRTLDPEWIDCP